MPIWRNLNKNSGPETSSEFPRFAILPEYRHTLKLEGKNILIPWEKTLEALCLELSQIFPYVLLTLADFGPRTLAVISSDHEKKIVTVSITTVSKLCESFQWIIWGWFWEPPQLAANVWSEGSLVEG